MLWPAVAPASRLDLTAEQGVAYQALSHSLSNYMNARATNLEVDLEKAGILEEVLLHVRGFDDADWNRSRIDFERVFSQAKLPQKTVVSVSLQSNAPFINNWAAGDPRTGQKVLDDLIRDYNMTVQGYGRFAPTFYDLVVPREMNTFALENQIAKGCGILSPTENWDPYAWGNASHIGDSVSLRADSRPEGWTVRISLGWGDCPSGCIYGRTYTFEIDTGGATRLTNVKGDPLQ